MTSKNVTIPISFSGAEMIQGYKGQTIVNVVNNIQVNKANNVQIGTQNCMNIHREDSSEYHYSEPSYYRQSSSYNTTDHLSPEESQELRSCDIKLDEDFTRVIARSISTNWYDFGKCLLTEDEVDCIDEEYYKQGVEEVLYHIVLSWKDKQDNPTIANLVKQFEDENYKLILYKLLKQPNRLAISAPPEKLAILPIE